MTATITLGKYYEIAASARLVALLLLPLLLPLPQNSTPRNYREIAPPPKRAASRPLARPLNNAAASTSQASQAQQAGFHPELGLLTN